MSLLLLVLLLSLLLQLSLLLSLLLLLKLCSSKNMIWGRINFYIIRVASFTPTYQI